MAAILGVASLQAAPLGNLSPAAALKAFETEPGFAASLVAAEPLTIDPVALAFDERGRLFVAEGRDYPVGLPDGRPLGVIAMLEDTDGDGHMDKRTDFAIAAYLGFANATGSEFRRIAGSNSKRFASLLAQAGGQELFPHFVIVAHGLLEELAEAPLEQAAVIPAKARDTLGGRGVPGQAGF